MKALKIVPILLSLCLFMPAGAYASTGDVAGFVIAIRGTVTATNAAGEERALKRRAKFYSNEVIKTGDGSAAQLRFKDRALMRLKAKSELNINDYHFGGASDPKNKSIMRLVTGGFRTISGSIGRTNKSAYRVDTPAASIGIRGTDYEVVIALDGGVYAAVWDGGVTLVNDLGELDLGSDSSFVYANMSSGQAPVGLENAPEGMFNVNNGLVAPLTAEQRAKVNKVLAASPVVPVSTVLTDVAKAQAQNEDPASLANSEGAATPPPGTLSDAQLAALESANVAFVYSDLNVTDIQTGKLIREENGDTVYVTPDNQIISFSSINSPMPEAQHAQVNWGRWDTVTSIAGLSTGAEIYWLDVDAYDPTIGTRSGSAALNLTQFSANVILPSGLEANDIPDIVTANEYGNLDVDFDTGDYEGALGFDLVIDGNTTDLSDGQFDISMDFDGKLGSNDISSSASLNGVKDLNGNGSIDPESEVETIILTNSSVEGAVTADGNAFAGAFGVAAPVNGVNVGVQGVFLMEDENN